MAWNPLGAAGPAAVCLSQLPFSASAGENEEERGVFGHTYRSSCGKEGKQKKRKEKYLSQLYYIGKKNGRKSI